jgi:CheY-like chemotaxis protein
MGSVLIVDDVAGSARLIASLLAPEGYALRPNGRPTSSSAKRRADGAGTIWS